MGTGPLRPDDGDDEFDEGFALEDLDEEFPDVTETAAGDPIDPAMRPVIEAGGGVSEGFELAEAELIEHATVGPDDGTEIVMEDAYPSEAEPDRAVYGEADRELVDEDEDEYGEPEHPPSP